MTLKELLLYPVSSAARSITNALIASAQCRCGRGHEYNALFGLDTCRRLDTRQNDGRSIEFDIFLSAGQGWVHARVHSAGETMVSSVLEVGSNAVAGTPRATTRVENLCETIREQQSPAVTYGLELVVVRGQLFHQQRQRIKSSFD